MEIRTTAFNAPEACAKKSILRKLELRQRRRRGVGIQRGARGSECGDRERTRTFAVSSRRRSASSEAQSYAAAARADAQGHVESKAMD